MNWTKNSLRCTDCATRVRNGTADFSAQFSLASSYGFVQVTYVGALDTSSLGGHWTGCTGNCNATDPKDPDNLFDTTGNLDNGGGSLHIGTWMVERRFASSKAAGSASPSVKRESALEALFVKAYQMYDPGIHGYGNTVITNSRSFEPNPTGTIFATGGQQ